MDLQEHQGQSSSRTMPFESDLTKTEAKRWRVMIGMIRDTDDRRTCGLCCVDSVHRDRNLLSDIPRWYNMNFNLQDGTTRPISAAYTI